MSVLRSASLALLPALVGASAVHAQRQGSYTLSGSRVSVYDLVGDVTLEPAGGGDVTVEVRPAGADAGRLQVRTGSIAGRNTLRVIYPEDEIRYDAFGAGNSTHFRVRDDGTWGGDNARGGRRVTISGSGGMDAHADLRIRIPAGRDVAVYIGAGRMTASNVDGTIRLDGANTPVKAERMRGRLVVDVGSGSVRIDGMEGDLSVDTGSGDVVAESVSGGPINIDTGSGEVRASGLRTPSLDIDTGSGQVLAADVTADRIRIDTGSGDVELGLGGTVRDLNIDTGSGAVVLRAPGSLDARVHLETSGDRISSDFAIQDARRDDGELDGRIGNGSGRIVIDTGSGAIRLVKR